MQAAENRKDGTIEKLHGLKLFRQQCYLNGAWRDAESGETIAVTNPATGAEIGRIPSMGRAEAREAVEMAEAAWEGWRGMTARARGEILKKWYRLILENADDLAFILTLEQGKPLAQAKGEVINGAAFIEWFAEEGRRIYGDVIPSQDVNTRIMTLKQPVGVSAAITPWNFPSSMITRKAGAALAAGCPIIVKPAEMTPFSALALAVLAEEAGVPAGLFNVITGKSREIGAEFCENDTVRKLSFTGSTAVGKILMKQCADTVKKLSLELGGNAPFIVFDDADLDTAVTGAVMSKYRNSGQTCICANRIFVQDGIYDAFLEKFRAAVEKMPVGNGLEEGVELGPMVNEEGVQKTQEHMQDALAKGARLVSGGSPHPLGGLFVHPVILADTTDEMACFSEETFGPLAPVFRFKEEDEVVTRANNTEYGLAAYVYTRDLGRFWRVSEKLEYGMVGINSGLLSTEQAPFGGIKQSGIGREGSKYGIEDYLEIKYLCVGGV
ncbi:MAG: NAD-dependent succinate-semialdehyde dehydrogenase [Micavibrio sp.]|nr:MAG: NAD-dependent succinate-semialdehyde dehydrogenase [Micavibrio sp.]